MTIATPDPTYKSPANTMTAPATKPTALPTGAPVVNSMAGAPGVPSGATPAPTTSAALPAVSGAAPTGPTFTGIGAGQTRTGLEAFNYLSSTYGTPLTQAQQQEAAQHIGYTDMSGASAITADNYNRLMQLAAQRSGGTYNPYAAPAAPAGGVTPFPTEGPLNPDPFPQPATGTQTTLGTQTAAPSYTAPRYQQQTFRPPTFAEMVAADPTYARRQGEAVGAVESRAAARGMLGTGTHLRDLNREVQDYASNEFGKFYNRKANEYGLDTSERRYGHESDTGAAQTEYAPSLLTWNRQEDQAQRGRELTYDRNWQRETYGRDDNYRRNRSGEDDYRYRNDDRQRNVDREESRRRFLAELGQA